MKKLFKFFVAIILATVLLSGFATVVQADSENLLFDPGFEEGVEEYWTGYSNALLTEDNETKHSGEASVFCEERASKNDVPRQDTTEMVSFYGVGDYQVSAWVYLPDADANVQIAMMVQCDDETWGPVKDGRKWFTTEYVTVKKGVWTKLEGKLTVDAAKDSELLLSEYYFNFDEKQGDAALQSYYTDDCSLIKLGKVPSLPTPTPEPTASPAPTATPIPTATPVLTATPVPTAAAVAATPTAVAGTTDQGDGNLWIWIVTAVIIIGGGIGGYLMAKKGKSDGNTEGPKPE